MAVDISLIKKLSCFQGLTKDKLDAISQISNSVCYLPGHILFEQGQKGETLYFLIDGDVEVLFKSAYTDPRRVDMISGAELVGCSAMVPPYTYKATEQCLTEVEVLEIELEALRNLIEKYPQIGLKMQEHVIKILYDRILHFRHQI